MFLNSVRTQFVFANSFSIYVTLLSGCILLEIIKAVIPFNFSYHLNVPSFKSNTLSGCIHLELIKAVIPLNFSYHSNVPSFKSNTAQGNQRSQQIFLSVVLIEE